MGAYGPGGGPRRGPRWLPDQQEVLLLRAALLPDGAAAWADLRAGGFTLDSAGGEASRLFPLVLRNLDALGVEDADRGRLKGLWRRTWVENQRRVVHAAEVATVLDGAGVPAMALKGLPLARSYLPDVGLRPMADIDLLVPYGTFARAAEALVDAGFWPSRDRTRPYNTARAFRRPPLEVDLHWRLHLGLVTPAAVPTPGRSCTDPSPVDDAATDAWAHAEALDLGPTALGRARLVQPDPTTMLVHACIHGAGTRSGARLRWAADASVVLDRRGDDVDWDRLVRLADQAQAGPVLACCLAWIRTHLDAAVPDGVVPALEARRPTRRAAWGNRWRLDPPMRSPAGGLPATVAKYLMVTASEPARRSAARFPAFLVDEWSLDSPAGVVTFVRSRARAALRRWPAAGRATP